MNNQQIFHRVLIVIVFIFVLGFNIKTLTGNNTTASVVSNKSQSLIENDNQNQDNFDIGFFYGENNKNELASLNKKSTVEALNVSIFSDNSVFPDGYSFEKSNSLVPFLFLNFFTNKNEKGFFDQVIDGVFDEGLKDLASKMHKIKTQSVIVPFYEFNNNKYKWNISAYQNSPEKFILAYRHVVNILKINENVKSAFVINSLSSPNNKDIDISLSYPGNDYVDITGVDGLNTGEPWRSFDDIFLGPVSSLKQFGKPIYVFSANSIDGAPSSQSKTEWINDMSSSFLIKNDEIKGLIWGNTSF